MFRNLSILGAAATAAAMTAFSAHAAVHVIGNGLANSCYRSAEFGSDPRSAIPACTLALEQEPLSVKDRAATYINRGILRSRTGNPQGALEDYNEGISIDANLGEGYVDRGAAYIALEQYRQALDDIDKGIAMGANKPHIAYYDRAVADEALGNIRAAYEDYKKAVALEPDFALATQQLSRFKVVRRNSGESD